MKNYNENRPHTEFNFTVSKKEVNQNKTLLPNILYDKMESTAETILNIHQEKFSFHQNLFKLNLLKNAYLKDNLKIIPKIQRLNSTEVRLNILVYKDKNDTTETICNATFGYVFKRKKKLDLAS